MSKQDFHSSRDRQNTYTNSQRIGNLPPVQSKIKITVNSKGGTFNPNSPRTRQALHELGMDLDSYEAKVYEDFGGPGVLEEIQKLRFSHYQKRLSQDQQDLINKRKEIIQRQRNELGRRDGMQYDLTSPKVNVPAVYAQSPDTSRLKKATKSQMFMEKPASNSAYVPSSIQIQSSILAPPMQSQKLQTPTQAQSQTQKSTMKKTIFEAKQDMSQLYNKTISYLRNSHYSPEVQKGEEVLYDQVYDHEDNNLVETQIFKEINKFNSIKEQRQKEAIQMYEDDLARIKLVEKMRNKEVSLLKNRVDAQKKCDKEKVEKKKNAEEKQQIIKAKDLQYYEKKKQERSNIEKKLMILKEKLEVQRKIQEREKEELKQKKLEKQEQVNKMVRQKAKEEIEGCDEQDKKICLKLSEANQRNQANLDNAKLALKKKGIMERENFEKSLIIKSSDEKSKVNGLIKGLFTQEEAEKRHVSQMILKKKEDLKKRKEKDEKVSIIMSKMEQDRSKETSNLEERFAKHQSNLETKRDEQIKDQLIKQEKRRLKEEDKVENYIRNKRKNDYRVESILAKEQEHGEKVQQIKQQQDIVKKARAEVSQQAKIEGERIFTTVKKVQNLFATVGFEGSTQKLTQNDKSKGATYLKSIIANENLDLSYFEPPKVEDPNNPLAQAQIKIKK